MVHKKGIECSLVHLSSETPLREINPWSSATTAGCDVEITDTERLEFVLGLPKQIHSPRDLLDFLKTRSDPHSIPKEPLEGFQVRVRIDGHPTGKTHLFRPGASLKDSYRRKIGEVALLKSKGKIDLTMELLPSAPNSEPFARFWFYYTNQVFGVENPTKPFHRETKHKEFRDRSRESFSNAPRDLGENGYPNYDASIDERVNIRAPTPPSVKLSRIEAENRELEMEILDLQSLIEKEKLSQLRLRDSRIPPSVAAYPSYPTYDSPYNPQVPASGRRSISPVRNRGGYPEDAREYYPPHVAPSAVQTTPAPIDHYARPPEGPTDVYGHYPIRDRDAERERGRAGFEGKDRSRTSSGYNGYSRRA